MCVQIVRNKDDDKMMIILYLSLHAIFEVSFIND